MGALTASAAIYQGKVFSDQLSATVWPYLAFVTTTSAKSVEFGVENDGAGPAIVNGASLLIDGRVQPSIMQALKALGFRSGRGGEVVSASVRPGQVVRAGAHIAIVRVVSAEFARRMVSQANRFSAQIYYCSMLNRCWLIKFPSERPIDAPSGGNYARGSIEP